MNFPSRKHVEMIRNHYPPGTRIELISMEDPYAPIPPGTKGTVAAVDDAGNLFMNWDDGRSLSVIPGEDNFKIIDAEQNRKNTRKQNGYER